MGRISRFIAFEFVVLIAAVLGYSGSRPGVITSYVAFGLHLLASIAAPIFVLTFN